MGEAFLAVAVRLQRQGERLQVYVDSCLALLLYSAAPKAAPIIYYFHYFFAFFFNA